MNQKIGHYMIGVGCIMQHEPTGKVLCLLRDGADYQKGEWELMYGRIDQHEELFEALQRELMEETGIAEFRVERLLRVWHFYRGEKSPETEIHGFTFHCVTQSQHVVLSPEHSEYRWVDPAEALELIQIHGIREDLRFFLEHATDRKVAMSGVTNVIEWVV